MSNKNIKKVLVFFALLLFCSFMYTIFFKTKFALKAESTLVIGDKIEIKKNILFVNEKNYMKNAYQMKENQINISNKNVHIENLNEKITKERIKNYKNINEKILRSEIEKEKFDIMNTDEVFFKSVMNIFNNFKVSIPVDEESRTERYAMIDIFINMLDSGVELSENSNLKNIITRDLAEFIVKKIPEKLPIEAKRAIVGDKIELFWILKSRKLINEEEILTAMTLEERKYMNINPGIY